MSRPVFTAKAARNVDKYLERYSDPAARRVALPAGLFDALIVIPARAEALALDATLDRIRSVAPAALTLVVVNARVDDDETVLAENQRVLSALDVREGVLAIDCTSAGAQLQPKEGVGRARRIGADVALRIIRDGGARSDTLYFTDADAVVPTGYVERGALEPHEACAVLPFVHAYSQPPRGDDDDDEARSSYRVACAAYEASLRLYALGLDAAGSPHAYCTLGSTITTRAETYAQVRGMPLRTAGEDFHYLDKAARTGVIARRGGAPISLSPRPSRRVPFGTGPSVARLAEHGAAMQMSLHPSLYDVLADARAALARSAASGRVHAPRNDRAAQAWAALNLENKLRAACASLTTPTQRLRAVHTVFSALKTRQFLHRVRDATDGGAISVFDAAQASPFVNDAARTAAAAGDALALCAELQSLCTERLRGPAGPCAADAGVHAATSPFR